MIDKRWWERHPERLEYELRALGEHGIEYERDEHAFRAGILRVRLRATVNGDKHRLVATFPDLYPYFRFEVAAPDGQLPHHQHPVSKFLCLMGRPTHNWETDDTLAKLVSQQVPRVLRAARTSDGAGVLEIEHRQAEPFSDYYPYAPSMFLVQGEWAIPKDESSGFLEIGLVPEHRDSTWLFGAVLEVRSNNHRCLAKADKRLRAIYCGPSLTVRWVRADAPISVFHQEAFFNHVRQLDFGRTRNQIHNRNSRGLQIWGVLFPDETEWRSRDQKGWVFVCRFERHVIKGANLFKHKEARPQQEFYFSRAGRAGPDDLAARTPELKPLARKTVALFGLGCLGASSALEFARAAVQQLRIVDHDTVDPGTVVRWPLGLSVAGHKKVQAICDFIKQNYPYCRVTPFEHRIGGVRSGNPDEVCDEAQLAKIISDASLIYDATAEIGVHHFLSDLARERGLPYVTVAGTYGGWGGKILRIRPGCTEGCWLCCQYATRDTIPEPPSGPENRTTVQPIGCANPTFTGAGFDLSQVALTGVRMAISTLCSDEPNGYPDSDVDVMTIAFRNNQGGLIVPTFQGYKLERHPKCPRCNQQ